MANQRYSNPILQRYGTCEMLIEDPYATNTFFRYGRVKSPKITTNNDTIQRDEIYGNIAEEVDSRVTALHAEFSAMLLEDRNPMVMQLLANEYTDTQLIRTDPSVTSISLSEPLWLGRSANIKQFTPITSGWCTLARLTPLTSATGAYSAAGGVGWTPGANHFTTVPIFGAILGVPPAAPATTISTWVAQKDIKGYWTGGTVAQSGSVSVLHAGGRVTITITQAALGQDDPMPDAWAIFQGTTSTSTAQKLNCTVPNTISRAGGTQAIILLAPSNGSSSLYTAPIGFSVRSIQSYVTGASTTTTGAGQAAIWGAGGSSAIGTATGGTFTSAPTYTILTSGTDYTYDQSTGSYVRITGGAISTGLVVEVTQWWMKPAYVQTNIGASSTNADYRRVWLIGLEPDVNPISGETIFVQGEEYMLERVNMAGLGFEGGFEEGAYDPGKTITTKCLRSDNNRFGYHITEGQEFRNYVQNYS